jgi:hypothetical protein
MPSGEWSVSGIVVKSTAPEKSSRAPYAPDPKPPRPALHHTPPTTAAAGTPLTLALVVPAASGVRTVRLYYRAVNQLATFKMLEGKPGENFTIPATDISARWDLMYYFEVLAGEVGWFEPDPAKQTPYYAVRIADK